MAQLGYAFSVFGEALKICLEFFGYIRFSLGFVVVSSCLTWACNALGMNVDMYMLPSIMFLSMFTFFAVVAYRQIAYYERYGDGDPEA